MKTIATCFALSLLVGTAGAAFAQQPDTLISAQGEIMNATYRKNR